MPLPTNHKAAPHFPSTDSVLTNLPWDSETFGFPVARMALPDLDEARLVDAILAAKDEGIRLAYWTTSVRLPIETNELLRKFGGNLVDRKVTYQADLRTRSYAARFPAIEELKVSEYPRTLPSAKLIALSLAAGRWSRFNTDTRLPSSCFSALYEAWIRRSTQRELADVVFSASTGEDDCVGMITIARFESVGQIGLIAVNDRHQGKGVGSLLMNAARDWMIEAGVAVGRVVTQQDNRDACKLYERHGYSVIDTVYVYHFWLA